MKYQSPVWLGMHVRSSAQGRKTTRREYERLVNYAIEIGVKNGYIQEGGTQKESFIPAWNGEGVRAPRCEDSTRL